MLLTVRCAWNRAYRFGNWWIQTSGDSALWYTTLKHWRLGGVSPYFALFMISSSNFATYSWNFDTRFDLLFQTHSVEVRTQLFKWGPIYICIYIYMYVLRIKLFTLELLLRILVETVMMASLFLLSYTRARTMFLDLLWSDRRSSEVARLMTWLSTGSRWFNGWGGGWVGYTIPSQECLLDVACDHIIHCSTKPTNIFLGVFCLIFKPACSKTGMDGAVLSQDGGWYLNPRIDVSWERFIFSSQCPSPPFVRPLLVISREVS